MNKKTNRNNNTTTHYSDLSTEQLLAIDKLCIRFERDLHDDITRSIEKILGQCDPEISRYVFIELLYLEVVYRRQQGEIVKEKHYIQRFPNFIPEIQQVFKDNDSSHALFSLPAQISDAEAEDISIDFNTETNLNISGYQIQKRLARGGMGVVYHAHDLTLHRDVAIKMLASDSLSEEQLERFYTEARVISGLSHANIIQLYSIGEHYQQPYLVLEYAGGGTLKDKLDAGPLTLNQTLSYMVQLAKTIEFVHRQGYLHRDLKPSNVLFDSEGNIKISDFGLVKDLASESELTKTQAQIGTPAFMAPEQVDRAFGHVSQATDIYGLGVLMHTMLTGHSLYTDLNPARIIKELISDIPVSKGQLIKHKVPKSFINVCLRCLQKNPKHRYQSTEELITDLLRLQQGASISSIPLYRRSAKKVVLITTTFGILFFVILLLNKQTIDTKPTTVTAQTSMTGAYSSNVISQLDATILEQLNQPYVGGNDFKILTLLAEDEPGLPAITLNSPQGLALYNDQYLAVADTLNNRILIIDLESGEISHLAGNGHEAYGGDNGPARKASLNQPVGMDFDETGNLYVADRANHAVRKIDSNGVITTAFGGTGCNIIKQSISFNGLCYPSDVVNSVNGKLFIADPLHQRIRKKHDNTLMTTIYHYNTNIPTDLYYSPYDFSPLPRAIEHYGDDLFFIEGGKGKLNKLNQDGSASTIASSFIQPMDIDIDTAGNIYITDQAGHPITRVDQTTKSVEIIKHETLFSKLDNEHQLHTISAITVDKQGRIFFTDTTHHALHVIIPNMDKPHLLMQAYEVPEPARHLHQYNFKKLDEVRRFSYVNTLATELFTDITYKLGLELYLHESFDYRDEVTIAENRLTAREMLTFMCFLYNVHCGIEGNTLMVASPDQYPSITSAKPIKMKHPLTFIKNSDAMPEQLKQEALREIVLTTRDKRRVYDFFVKIDEMSIYDFDFAPSMEILKQGELDLNGRYRIGDLLASLVLWKKVNFTYDETSGKIVIEKWQAEN